MARALSDDYGIGVRDGRFCAHPLVDRLAGPGGAAVRASLGLGPVDEHVDRLLTALAALTAQTALAANTALPPAAGGEPGPRPQSARTPAPRLATAITRRPRSVVPV